jgi:DNA-binding response OmpR family regulator
LKPSAPLKILMIRTDSPLTYLINRYAERSGSRINTIEALPSTQEVYSAKPSVILFPSIESLETAQGKIIDLVNNDVPIIVCSSIVDEARARELGADYCLLHPLTYEDFVAALTAVQTSSTHQP